jgi:hypothetical protein
MSIQTPMDAAMAWVDATRTCAESAQRTWWQMTSDAAEMWAMPATTFFAAADAAREASKPRSWYRKPVETPLDAVMSWFAPREHAPVAAYTNSPFGWFAATAWPQPAMGAWAPFTPPGVDLNRFWSAMQIAMAAAPYQRAMVDAAAQLAPAAQTGSFAAFRTDGGHATAHVTMGQALLALMPLLMAMSILMLGMQMPPSLA